MACTSPMYRIPNDCSNYFLLPEHDRKRVKNDGVFFYDLNAIRYLEQNLPGWDPMQVQTIPCGRCVNCKLTYSRDWAIRCSLEAEAHEHNYFVTLTYDDFHLPGKDGEYVDYSGEVWGSTLCLRDVQLFMKSLREWERTTNGNTNIKVFYCGEYGGQTGRPHYHLCLFGCSEIPDLSFSFKRGDYKYYKSTLYESFWSERVKGVGEILRGFVDISDLSFDTVAYTARYCMKKVDRYDKKLFLEFYNELDEDQRLPLRKPPFIRMSNRPGIASEYWRENKDQIKTEDLVKYQKRYELYKSKPPRYFDKLFDREDPDQFKTVKERRVLKGFLAKQLRKKQYSESDEARLAREDQITKSKQQRYSRSL